MPDSPIRPRDCVTLSGDEIFRVVETGEMPDAPGIPAILVEWRDGGVTYRCWAPASAFERISVQ